MYAKLASANVLEKTGGRTWATLAERWLNDDGSWNNSGLSWAESNGKTLEWCQEADELFAQQRGN